MAHHGTHSAGFRTSLNSDIEGDKCWIGNHQGLDRQIDQALVKSLEVPRSAFPAEGIGANEGFLRCVTVQLR